MVRYLLQLFLILYLINYIASTNDKIIECVYHESTREYNLEIFLDSSDVYAFYEPINQKLQYTWTSSKVSIQKFQDKIVGHQMKTINNNELNATEYRKVIELNKEDDALLNFNFFHINTLDTKIEETGGFGFAFKFNNYKYSLVHQLKKENMIDHLSYAILPKKTNKGNFYFGGIPNELTKDVDVTKCKVNPDYITWGCNMTNVVFGDLKATDINTLPNYVNIHYAYFQSGIKNTRVPGDFLDFLAKTVLFSLIESKKCLYETEIICAVNSIKSIPLFNYVFEGRLALVFDWNYLFECSNQYCTFTLEKNEESDEWVFGTGFFGKYGMLFDYEDESISFYTKKDYVMLNNNCKDKKNKDNSKKIKWLYRLILVLLITISGLLAWIKYSLSSKSLSLNIYI